MEDRKWWKLTWIALFLMVCVATSPVLMAQYDDEEDEGDDEEDEETAQLIVVKGKGTKVEGAIVDAWKKAMMKHLKDNLETEAYEANQNQIEDFVLNNWREYALGDPDKPKVVKKFYNRTITIMAKVDGDRLMKDVEHRFTKSQGKLEGMEVALVSENEPDKAAKDEWLNRDAMFDTVQDYLGRFMTVRNLKAIKELMETEARSLGTSAQADPGTYIQRKFDMVKVVIYLSLTTEKRPEPDSKDVSWFATVSCRGLWKQDARELWRFQIKSGDTSSTWTTKNGVRNSIMPDGTQLPGDREARLQAIKDVAKAVAVKIDFEIRSRTTNIKEDTYILNFVGFNQSQRDKISQAIGDMSEGKKPPFKVEKGGGSSGQDYFTIKIKWLRGGSQDEIVRQVREVCGDNEVRVDAYKTSPGVIYFQPTKVDDNG